jgi:hypothetical protein
MDTFRRTWDTMISWIPLDGLLQRINSHSNNTISRSKVHMHPSTQPSLHSITTISSSKRIPHTTTLHMSLNPNTSMQDRQMCLAQIHSTLILPFHRMQLHTLPITPTRLVSMEQKPTTQSLHRTFSIKSPRPKLRSIAVYKTRPISSGPQTISTRDLRLKQICTLTMHRMEMPAAWRAPFNIPHCQVTMALKLSRT